jgi:uncharacterized membrane protein
MKRNWWYFLSGGMTITTIAILMFLIAIYGTIYVIIPILEALGSLEGWRRWVAWGLCFLLASILGGWWIERFEASSGGHR